MTRTEFTNKYGEFFDVTNDEILLRVNSNLSDLHIETKIKSPEEIDEKLNALKTYISDFRSVLKTEKRNPKTPISHE